VRLRGELLRLKGRASFLTRQSLWLGACALRQPGLGRSDDKKPFEISTSASGEIAASAPSGVNW
jgi:hypothetical protein